MERVAGAVRQSFRVTEAKHYVRPGGKAPTGTKQRAAG